jgi:DNA primase
MSLFAIIKSKLAIADVISEYVQLKLAGNYWKGPCPFHSEKDASFTVTPGREIFYCFGCHSGGDVIAFIAKIENISQIEAAKHLVERYGIDVPDSAKHEIAALSVSFSEKEHHFMICAKAAEWFEAQLKNNAEAMAYVQKRQISADAIKAFQMGYLPGGMRAINQFIADMAKKNILLKDLIEIGILAEGKAAMYSPFEERILFPIADTLGRICGFGGRIFKPNDTRAKYYNSKEAPTFQKGGLFFGLSLAKHMMKEKHNGFLVEGYTDCIAMWQYGYPNTVATLGTACTQEHLKILSRYINTLYVLYDGDASGQKAILRLVELCWEVDLELRVIKLPQADDPASFLTNGGDLSESIAQSLDIFSFCIKETGERFSGKSLQEKLELGNKITGLLSQVGDPFKRDLLIGQAATTLHMPFDSLKKKIEQARKKPVYVEKEPLLEDKAKSDENPFNSMSQLEKNILFVIINSIDKAEGFTIEPHMIPYFSDSFQTIFDKLETARTQNDGQNRFLFFYDKLDEITKEWINSNILHYSGDITQPLFDQLLTQFYKKKWRQMVQDIKEGMTHSQELQDEKTLILTRQFLELKVEMKRRGLI